MYLLWYLLWFNKKLIIYLDGPIYFSKDSKNHSSDDIWLKKNVVMLLK